MSYNGHNDLTKISVGTSVLAAYSYTNDPNRYLSALAYGNGDVVEYTYDELGRVTREDYRENGSTAISRTVAYTYNEAGNLHVCEGDDNYLTVDQDQDRIAAGNSSVKDYGGAKWSYDATHGLVSQVKKDGFQYALYYS